mmetsp:Transcript_2515/g.5780  ORF Transcript_2515/g.5780 Transcript_2515/m.5780 type:complete len:145 (+) Transcript_2515:1312-1746(+)
MTRSRGCRGLLLRPLEQKKGKEKAVMVRRIETDGPLQLAFPRMLAPMQATSETITTKLMTNSATSSSLPSRGYFASRVSLRVPVGPAIRIRMGSSVLWLGDTAHLRWQRLPLDKSCPLLSVRVPLAVLVRVIPAEVRVAFPQAP